MQNTKDIVIKQGANFKMTIDYRNPDNTGINLTGYTFKMMIKSAPNGTLYLDASAYVTRDTTTTGRILVNIPHSATTGLSFRQGVYDILITAPDTGRTRIVQGAVRLDPAVTT